MTDVDSKSLPCERAAITEAGSDVVALSECGIIKGSPRSLKKIVPPSSVDDEHEEDDDEEEGEDEAGSLVDFIVDDEDDEADASGVSDEEEEDRRSLSVDESVDESGNRDMDGIDPANIVTGKRRRVQTQFYEQQVFNSEEYKRMILCDIPKEEMHAVMESDDEEESEDCEDEEVEDDFSESEQESDDEAKDKMSGAR